MLGLTTPELGPESADTTMKAERAVVTRSGAKWLRVLTHNMGGLDPVSLDVFRNWLSTQQHADIVMLQGLHWGCGREDTQWMLDSG